MDQQQFIALSQLRFQQILFMYTLIIIISQMSYFSTSNSTYGSGLYRGKTPIKYPQTTSSILNSINNSNNLNIISQPQGLINLRNTCYISAVLQILFEIIDIKVASYTKQITRAFINLKKSYSKYDYIDFKKVVEQKLQFVQGHDQQDAQQFLRGLLQILNQENSYCQSVTKKLVFKINEKYSVKQNWKIFCEEIKKFDNSLIIDTFSSEIYQELQCVNKHKKYNFERMMDFTLAFPNVRQIYSVKEFILNYFKQQLMNDIQCEKCKKKTKFTKRLRIYKYPQILALHINRFKQDYTYNSKIRNQIIFDQFFEFPEAIIHEDIKKQKPKYELFGIINHIGSLNSGHYYTEKKIKGKWYEINDEIVRSANIKDKDNQSQYAYILFYKKL